MSTRPTKIRQEVFFEVHHSVEGIVESVQQQAEQLIDSVVDQGKEAINKLEKTFEELQAQGEQLIDQAEQAAADGGHRQDHGVYGPLSEFYAEPRRVLQHQHHRRIEHHTTTV